MITKKPIAHVSDEKKKVVKELTDFIKKKKTMLVVSVKNIPASQFQELSKKLRGRVEVRVPKKNLIGRAIENSGEEQAKALTPKIKENIAVLFSDIDCFDLSTELIKNKSAKASAGQEAPEDIEIPAGPTDLLPGPAISDLGALGIQIQIEKGKISIKEAKIVAKKGDKISAPVADLLSKLDIKPFSISLIPLAGYDTKEKKVYLNIEINIEKSIADLKNAFSKALPFAVEIGYTCNDSINFLLQKAERQSKAMEIITANHTPQTMREEINKMENIYAALLLHKLGKEVSEANLKSVVAAAGGQVDESKIKSLVASLKGVDIDKELASASLVAAAPASEAPKAEKKETKIEEKKEAAAEGLSALFG